MHKYTIKRLIHLLSGGLLGFLFLFGPRKKRIIFNSTLNEHFNFNSKFLFLYALDQGKFDFEIKFVINDDTKRSLLEVQYGPHFISTHSLRGKLYALCAAVWVTSSLETPVGGCFLKVRRFVYHLGHGVPIKAIGLSENRRSILKRIYYKFVYTNFTKFLSPTEYLRPCIERSFGVSSEQTVVLPQPRLSVIESLEVRQPTRIGSRLKILYAPTWRPYGEVKLFPLKDFDLAKLNDALERNNIVIYLRLHPAHEESSDVKTILGDNIKVLSTANVHEINDVIHEFDALITDYSSIYVDFLLVDRPILFFPYDREEYERVVGFSFSYDDVTPGEHIYEWRDFKMALDNLISGVDNYRQLRRDLSIKFNGAVYEALQRNMEFIEFQARRYIR